MKTTTTASTKSKIRKKYVNEKRCMRADDLMLCRQIVRSLTNIYSQIRCAINHRPRLIELVDAWMRWLLFDWLSRWIKKVLFLNFHFFFFFLKLLHFFFVYWFRSWPSLFQLNWFSNWNRCECAEKKTVSCE